MIPLLRFLIRFQKILLFLLLETIAFVLIFNNSNFQKTQLISIVQDIKGTVYEKVSGIQQYFALKTENEKLLAENLELQKKLNYYTNLDTIRSGTVKDILYSSVYNYTTAKIIRNSTNKQHNFLILNIGENQGVHPEMGVISNEGMVGMIVKVSANFSEAISILNMGFAKFSGKLKRCGDYGTISWNGADINTVQLNDIIQQSDVVVGDTVITSQHSGIFPENIAIGTVSKINVKDGTFYEIDVKLIQNMKLLNNVYVIDIPDKDEIEKLLKNE